MFYHNDEQKKKAEFYKEKVDASGAYDDPIVTTIEPFENYSEAEDYHQDYYKKNPIRYKYYRNGCRRDARIEQLWGAKK